MPKSGKAWGKTIRRIWTDSTDTTRKDILETAQPRGCVVKKKKSFFRSIREIRSNPSNRFSPGLSVLLLFIAATVNAQSIEGRIDAIAAGPAAVHAAAGFSVPMGTYVRAGMVGGLGMAESGSPSGRIDGFARFHLDPLRQHKWAPYGGGGLTARFDDNRSTRYYLLVFLGIDGPVAHKLSTSVEAGFGGGGRIGVIVHRAGERR